jgi:hypothetical protein
MEKHWLRKWVEDWVKEEFQTGIKWILRAVIVATVGFVVAVVTQLSPEWGNSIVIGLSAATIAYLLFFLHRSSRLGKTPQSSASIQAVIQDANEDEQLDVLRMLEKKFPPKMRKFLLADREYSPTAKAMLAWLENHNGEPKEKVIRDWKSMYVIQARCERDLGRFVEIGFVEIGSNGLYKVTELGKEFLILLLDVSEKREAQPITPSIPDTSTASQRTGQQGHSGDAGHES